MFKKIAVKITTAVRSIKKGIVTAAVAIGVGTAASLSAPGASHAAAMVDYSGLTTSVTTELTAALTVVVPLAGTILAAFLGWKFVHRFLK